MEAYLQKELERYHRRYGTKDGSRLVGPQKVYHPFKLPELAKFFASRPDVLYIPGSPVVREALRQAYLKDASSSNIKLIDKLKDLGKRVLTQKGYETLNAALAKVSPQFWIVPSSSTGKYHPVDEFSPGGLILHTLRVVRTMELLIQHLSDIGYKVENTDNLYLACFLHDTFKGFGDWTKTHYEHGHIAADQLREFIDEETRNLIRHHMAQWNAPKPTPPENLREQLMSYADYICSRNDIYIEV